MGKLLVASVGIVTLSALLSCSHEDDGRRDHAGPPEDRGHVTIYSSLPLQGDAKPQSEDVVRAFELALDDHDSRAGGYDITYVSLDDVDPAQGFWTAEVAAANAWTAAEDPSTIAYLGEFNSGATAASLPILNYVGIPQVSPSNTYAGLTRPDGGEPGEPDSFYPSGERTYARVVPADHVQAGALLSDMAAQGCSSVFVVHHNETYGLGLADAVETAAADAGVDVVGRTRLGPRALDDLVAADPDCMMFAGLTFDGAADVANVAGRALPDLRMFFPDGCAETAFTEAVDEDLWGRVFITNPTLDPPLYPQLGQDFFDHFREEYGHRPEPYAIYGYEAMSLVLDAIERAGAEAAPTEAGRAAVVDALFATTGRDSVLGTYDIDDYGDTTLAAYGSFVIEDGNVTWDHVIEPAVVPPSTGPEITDPPAPPVEPQDETGQPTPIEGSWVGGKVTEQMVAAEVGRKAARFVFEANGDARYLVTTLELTGDQWQAYVSVDGGPDQLAQAGTFTTEGDRIHFEETVGASYEYRYFVEGDTLRITLVGSDSPPAAPGVSDDVFQYTHLEATPFHQRP